MLIDRSADGFDITTVINVEDLKRLLGLYVQRAAGEDWRRSITDVQVTMKDRNVWPLADVLTGLTVTVRQRGVRRLAPPAAQPQVQPDLTVTRLVHADEDDCA